MYFGFHKTIGFRRTFEGVGLSAVECHGHGVAQADAVQHGNAASVDPTGGDNENVSAILGGYHRDALPFARKSVGVWCQHLKVGTEGVAPLQCEGLALCCCDLVVASDGGGRSDAVTAIEDGIIWVSDTVGILAAADSIYGVVVCHNREGCHRHIRVAWL